MMSPPRLLVRLILLLLAAVPTATGQPLPLDDAYQALRSRQYATAIDRFRQAAISEPSKASIQKDLAYTYLKVGETEAARDAFAAAMSIDAADEHTALEYAFLCHETRQTQMARLVFQKLSASAEASVRATAQTAFQNIDAPLAAGIARWQQALAGDPGNYSAHFELAELAERRNELALAVEHYEEARRLKPGQRQILIRLAKLYQALRRPEDAFLALLAASRCVESHTAEAARALLPSRYPYVYEFEQSLTRDPENTGLRRELAYLLLQMGRTADAEREFARLVKLMPDDHVAAAQLGFLYLDRGEREAALRLLQPVLEKGQPDLADRVRQALKLPQQLRPRAEVPRAALAGEARELADASLKAGYLKDAVKYLHTAHENDPVDFGVMRQLGWTYNILKQDNEAVKWFDLASRSDDPVISAEASQAVKNLTQAGATEPKFRVSLWSYPVFSTRWHDVFAYAQAKVEYRLASYLHAYASVRLVGDARSSFQAIKTAYLSETAVVAAFGLTTKTWHGARLWGEAGSSINYLQKRKDVGHMVPDYRGGLAFSHSLGRHVASSKPGVFAETHEDLLYISRFNKDTILYSQNRVGFTMPALGALRWQLLWNANLTADQQRQYWATFAETGPGVRFRVSGMPPSVYLMISALRGYYLIQEGNPYGPQFNDLRIGAWYALAR